MGLCFLGEKASIERIILKMLKEKVQITYLIICGKINLES